MAVDRMDMASTGEWGSKGREFSDIGESLLRDALVLVRAVFLLAVKVV